MLELTPDKWKSIATTLIASFDSGSLAFVSALLYFVEPDLEKVIKGWFWMGIGGSVLYFLVVPESPRYLFMNKKAKQAIDVLNYIAWFNFSKLRIPSDAQFDTIGQIVNENTALNHTIMGHSRVH